MTQYLVGSVLHTSNVAPVWRERWEQKKIFFCYFNEQLGAHRFWRVKNLKEKESRLFTRRAVLATKWQQLPNSPTRCCFGILSLFFKRQWNTTENKTDTPNDFPTVWNSCVYYVKAGYLITWEPFSCRRLRLLSFYPQMPTRSLKAQTHRVSKHAHSEKTISACNCF